MNQSYKSSNVTNKSKRLGIIDQRPVSARTKTKRSVVVEYRRQTFGISAVWGNWHNWSSYATEQVANHFIATRAFQAGAKHYEWRIKEGT